MNRLILIAAALFVAAALAFAFWPADGPTPQEQAQDAADAARETVAAAADAVSEAAGAVGEATSDAAEAATDTATTAAESAAALATDTAAAAGAEMTALAEQLQETGILTDAGLDFDRALGAVADSGLSDPQKDQLSTLITEMRDNPEQVLTKLAELRTMLGL